MQKSDLEVHLRRVVFLEQTLYALDRALWHISEHMEGELPASERVALDDVRVLLARRLEDAEERLGAAYAGGPLEPVHRAFAIVCSMLDELTNASGTGNVETRLGVILENPEAIRDSQPTLYRAFRAGDSMANTLYQEAVAYAQNPESSGFFRHLRYISGQRISDAFTIKGLNGKIV